MMSRTQGPKIQSIELVEWKPGHWRLHGQMLGISADLTGENPKELMEVFVNAMKARLS